MFRRRNSRLPISSSNSLSSAAARIARSACSLKKSKNFPSRGRSRTIAAFAPYAPSARSQGGAIIAPRMRGAQSNSVAVSAGRDSTTKVKSKRFARFAKRAILQRQKDERVSHDDDSEWDTDRGTGRRLFLVPGGRVRSACGRAIGRVGLRRRARTRTQL